MTLVRSVQQCTVCSAVNAACGHLPAPAAGGIVLPEENTVSGPATKTYDIEVNGYPTRMKLNDADAERLGVRKGRSSGEDHDEKAADAPANKSRSSASK